MKDISFNQFEIDMGGNYSDEGLDALYDLLKSEGDTYDPDAILSYWREYFDAEEAIRENRNIKDYDDLYGDCEVVEYFGGILIGGL